MSVPTLNVSEIFYSIQGEGFRAGQPSVFVRLQGCSMRYACMKAGVLCDTEFESGRAMSLGQILDWVQEYAPKCKWLIFTGGEPMDQLTSEHVKFFQYYDFNIAIETSGVKPVPFGVDWLVVSPKVAEHVLAKNFADGVDELRYVRHAGQDIPLPAVRAKQKYLSPHSDGSHLNVENVRHCLELVKLHPDWTLSLQYHKVLGVL